MLQRELKAAKKTRRTNEMLAASPRSIRLYVFMALGTVLETSKRVQVFFILRRSKRLFMENRSWLASFQHAEDCSIRTSEAEIESTRHSAENQRMKSG